MVTIQYTISKEDYINYYTYVVWDGPGNRKKRINYYIRQIVPIALFIIAFYYTGLFERNNRFILLALGFLFLTSLLSLSGVRSNAIKSAEKIVDDPANGSIFQEIDMSVSETGIVGKTITEETRYQWKAFIKKQESDAYYFLFLNAMQAVIIPKRAFKNTNDKAQFEKMLSHYLSFDAEIGHLVKS